MSPQRIQRRRTRGWRMPEGAVYVGRGSKWGNPFRVGNIEEFGEVPTAEEAVSLFERWWTTPAKFVIPWPPPLEDLLELRGKDLACWCRIDLPCHADVLLKLAERYAQFRAENPQCFEDSPGFGSRGNT